MAHYAKVEYGIVTKVIVAEPEFFNTFIDSSPGEWIQTSYNTYKGVHHNPETGEPDNGVALRKNYAGIGYTYDQVRDAFIPPKPFNSWILNEDTCRWEAPVARPKEELEDNQYYSWNESIINWEIKTIV
jgi:hypothetical protein